MRISARCAAAMAERMDCVKSADAVMSAADAENKYKNSLLSSSKP